MSYPANTPVTHLPAHGIAHWRISIVEVPTDGVFKRFSGKIAIEVANVLPRHDHWSFRLTRPDQSVRYDAVLQRAETTGLNTISYEFQMIDTGNGTPVAEFELSSDDPQADGCELIFMPLIVDGKGQCRPVVAV